MDQVQDHPAGPSQESTQQQQQQQQQRQQRHQQQQQQDAEVVQVLQALSRKELLEFIQAEAGQDSSNYSSLSKPMLIDRIRSLLPSIVAGRGAVNSTKRINNKRKVAARAPPAVDKTICSNSVCRAPLQGAAFCARCSCFLCHRFDGNKDPSLWVVCEDGGDRCGASCHLLCALRKKVAGVYPGKGLDAGFKCPNCERVTSLIGLWRKQLIEAKVAGSVDLLMQRLVLAKRILDGTKAHSHLHAWVREATELLVKETGPRPSSTPVVDVSCSPKVLELISNAIAASQARLPNNVPKPNGPLLDIHYRETTATSVLMAITMRPSTEAYNVHGFKLWHRQVLGGTYRAGYTAAMSAMQLVKVTDLRPGTEYEFKVLPFTLDDGGSTMVDLAVPAQEFRLATLSCHGVTPLQQQLLPDERLQKKMAEEPSPSKKGKLEPPPKVKEEEEEGARVGDEAMQEAQQPADIPGSYLQLATQLSQSLPSAELQQQQQQQNDNPSAESVVMKQQQAGCDDGGQSKLEAAAAAATAATRAAAVAAVEQQEAIVTDSAVERCVNTVRWLECHGHIAPEFRKRFFTWFGLRASEHDKRVISIYVATMGHNPAELAGQLVDAFGLVISANRRSGDDHSLY